jgi:predicted nucleic acid-binding protein
MKRRVYADTSVIGGWLDVEFKADSIHLFENFIKGKDKMIISNIVLDELLKAPDDIRAQLEQIPIENQEIITMNEEMETLANQYLSENVVPLHSTEDAQHIAIATVVSANVLVSWNFKHIVNLDRIQGYNSVNIKLGYPMIDIRSPKELIHYEE